MLIRRLHALLLAMVFVLVGVLVSAAPASANGCDLDPFSPTCVVTIPVPGGGGGTTPNPGGGGGDDGAPGGFTPGPTTCKFDDTEVRARATRAATAITATAPAT